jgi:hypothetical protein
VEGLAEGFPISLYILLESSMGGPLWDVRFVFMFSAYAFPSSTKTTHGIGVSENKIGVHKQLDK